MKLAQVASSGNHVHKVEIKEEMERRGHQCDLLYFPVWSIGPTVMNDTLSILSQYDVVHFVLGFNEELSSILQSKLVARGVSCPNSKTNVVNINDKIVQMTILAEHGVPTPKSFRVIRPTREEMSEVLEFPFVIKKPVGRQGKQVALCTEDNFDDFFKKGEEYLAQEYIRYTADYRVHVAGDNVYCAYERIAPGNDFRANVSLGGAMRKIEDPELLGRLSDLALRAARALVMDYGGVDIISDDAGKLLVLEFNPNPGFKNVTEVTGVLFQKSIADYYESLVV